MASTDHLGSGNSVTVSFNGIETVPEQPSQSINDNTSGVTSYGAAIEIDDQQSEADSTYGEGPGSYTTSLASSILDYKYENGRRYNAYREGAYPLPNDDVEQDRLDLFHHIHGLVLGGKLCLAPIPQDPQRVLDVGTGTGIWAIDFADAYPSAQVVGTDLSPIQPRSVPPNLEFVVDDAEGDWVYPYNFDFIHLRTLGGSLKNVPRLLKQAYDNLEPGGWIEWQEYEGKWRSDDGSLQGSKTMEWQNHINESSERNFGAPLNIAPTLKSEMEKVGFVNVQDEMYKVPVGPWAKDKQLKEQGLWVLLGVDDSIEPYTLKYLQASGWSKLEMDVMIALVRKEIKSKTIHMYSTIHFIYGQKPKDGSKPNT